MKIAVCFVAIVIGYAYAVPCSDSNPCQTSDTTCANGFTLTCSQGHCICSGNNNQGTCTQQSDCGHHGHSCNHDDHQFHCVDGHCTCGTHQNGNHPPGGHGGN